MDRKNDSIEFGILLVGIGVIWLLFRMDILDFSIFRGLRVLWPGIFIVVGLSIIFSRVRGASTVLWLLFIIMVLGYGKFYTFGDLESSSSWINFDVNLSEYEYLGHETDRVEMKDYESGDFILEYPAANLTIKESDDALIEYSHPKDLVEMDISGVSHARVELDIDDWHLGFNDSKGTYDMAYKLNEDIPWDIEINTGAMECDLDLSSLEVESLEVNSAAGDISIKISDMAKKAHVALNTAAADVTFEVPETVGVMIDVNGLVKDISFEGGNFYKEDGVYYSKGYSNSDKKVKIEVALVAGDLNIKQY